MKKTGKILAIGAIALIVLLALSPMSVTAEDEKPKIRVIINPDRTYGIEDDRLQMSFDNKAD